jgi:Holliday junction DNA helicase RuvB
MPYLERPKPFSSRNTKSVLGQEQVGFFGLKGNGMNTPKDLATTEPETLHDMVGQEHARTQLITAIRSAVADNRIVDSPILLLGPGGCGKSQSAKALATMVGASDFRTVLGPSLRTPADLSALFLEQKARSVLFIDEAVLPDSVQLAMYLALDSHKIFLPSAGRSPVALDIEPFVLVLATTHAFLLNDSLKQRCRIIVNFRHSEPAELEEIARRRAHALGWSVEDEVFREASIRGRGTPRLVLRLLNASMRTTRSEGADRITGEHFRQACFLEGIDRIGCDSVEQQYLLLLLEHGPSRLGMIASRMGLPRQTIERVVESEWLIRADLIAKDEKSQRHLTARGLDHAALLKAGLGYD